MDMKNLIANIEKLRTYSSYSIWLTALVFVVVVQPLYLLPLDQVLPFVLMPVMVGLFLKRPLISSTAGGRWYATGLFLDMAMIVGAVLVGVYIGVNYSAIIFRQGAFTGTDEVIALIGLVLTLETVRRSVGWPLTIVCLVFLLYAIFGRHMPGPLINRGYPLGKSAKYLMLSYGGVYGIPLVIMVRYVILFMVFGGLLQISGAADFLVRIAQSIAGRYTGGLGKIAVLASAFIGSISGSAAGNVATVGSVTIPAMKEGSYPAQFAAAIEATASTGGQILPPIMGAAAFLMADYLGKPYIEIAKAAILPAIFYFISVGIAIDLYARRYGLRGLPRRDLPKFLPTLARGWYFLIVIALVYGLLIEGSSPTRAAFVGVIAAAVLALIKRPNLRGLAKTLAITAESAAVLCAVTAGAGIVVGVTQLTGVGAQLASILVTASMGHLVVLLLMVTAVSLVLGMGMPTTVVYVLLAALVGPAIEKMGLHALTANFFFFYFGVLAAITPPVALASYAAASIAGSSMNKTAWTAFKMALPSFIVPFFFAYNPSLLMEGPALQIVLHATVALVGIAFFSIATIGSLNGDVAPWKRILLFAAGALLINANWITYTIGLVVGCLVVFTQLSHMRTPKSEYV
ncbi:MAG TPA: TRAP transporter fused permease subunit [Gammaproteobacteria bacterium]|nr:TRAP transporter fused permease subunit [Gammaproteobacteria bacterium]